MKAIKEHKAAILVSVLIGLIFLLPHILSPILQDENQNYSPLVVKGVDARSVDEVLYAAYVQEVAEGHLIPRSNILEWKDQLILSHAGAPFPSLILGLISLVVGGVVNTYIVSYFLFAALSSLLIYSLAYLLTKNKIISLVAPPLLFFSPTYILKFFHDNITQPISYFSRFYPALVDFPIFAVTLLLVFFLLHKKEWKFAVIGGIMGGLLFYTYFYYWTFYLVFIGALGIGYLIKKDLKLLKKITVSGILTAALGATFFLNSWETVQNQAEIFQRIGTTFTRTPDWNITLFLLTIGLLWYYVWKKNSKDKSKKNIEFIFLAALLLAGLVSMNVQVLTGYTINPRHWLTTAIWPSLILVGIYVLNGVEKITKKKIKKPIAIAGVAIITALLLFGVVWQVTFSKNTYSAYTLSDSQTELFAWLNQNTEKDDVVLSLSAEMILLLPAYTHNNNYIPNANVESVPISEIVARRLIAYKMLQVSEEDIPFLESPCAFEDLLRNFEDRKNGKYNYALFEEAFSHHLTFESYFAKKGCTTPDEYKEGVFKAYQYLPKEWGKLVGKYQVNYIVIGPYEKSISKREIEKHAQAIYQNSEFIVYRLTQQHRNKNAEGEAASQSDPVKGAWCEHYCSCIQKSCSGYAEYPFADQSSCLSACASYSMEEVGCLKHFCSVNTEKEEHISVSIPGENTY